MSSVFPGRATSTPAAGASPAAAASSNLSQRSRRWATPSLAVWVSTSQEPRQSSSRLRPCQRLVALWGVPSPSSTSARVRQRPSIKAASSPPRSGRNLAPAPVQSEPVRWLSRAPISEGLILQLSPQQRRTLELIEFQIFQVIHRLMPLAGVDPQLAQPVLLGSHQPIAQVTGGIA